MKKTILWILKLVLAFVVVVFIYVNLPVRTPDSKYELGVTFSSKYAEAVQLDWRETFVAILDDLQVKKIRIPVYWEDVEPREGEYNFSNIDWQLDEAAKRKAEVILVVGQKVPRWPECFVPQWAKDDDAKRKASLVKLVETVISRYKDSTAVKAWQIENEPFLNFGVCPEFDVELLDREIAVARATDSTRPIVITDSGEISIWIKAAKRADIFGTTMYREVNSQTMGHWKYPIGPNFFKIKKLIIRLLAAQDESVVIELQGEPWLAGWTTGFPLDQQFQSMDEKRLVDNVQFARQAGFDEIYIWGAEWWYWLKVNKHYPVVWDTAKNLFSER